MDPNDPIAQSIGYEYEQGLQDPSRAQTILKMLPRLVTDRMNPAPIQATSGLPQTGQEALADISSLAGQAPSGIGTDVKMGTNLADLYARRANRNLTADVANAEQGAQIPFRTQQALNLLKSFGEQASPEITLKEGETRFRQGPSGGYEKVAAGGQSAGIAKPDPSKFTPESLRAFQESGGDYGSLVPREGSGMAPLPGVPGLFYSKGAGGPQIVDASGRAVSTEETQSMAQALRPPGTTVSVNTAGEKVYSQTVNKAIGEADVAQVQKARTAMNDLRQIDETLRVLKNSNAITGPYAEFFTIFAQAKQVLAKDKAAGVQVTDTQYLDSLLGSQVFPLIKQLGIGARGLDTPAEREFLRRVMTGTISLNRGTLTQMMERVRRDAVHNIDQYNQRVKSGELDQFFEQSRQPSKTLQAPPKGTAGMDETGTSGSMEGRTATGPNGQKIIFRNGQWGSM